MKKNIILAVGTLPPPMHGQAMAFLVTTSSVKDIKYIVNNNFSKLSFLNKTLKTVFSIFHITYYFIFYNFNIVYFTSSRSKLGCIKDLYLIFLCIIFNKKTVNHVQGAEFKYLYQSSGLFLRFLIKSLYSKININILLFDKMKEQYLEVAKKNTFITIPNFYDDDIVFNLKKDLKKGDTIHFLYLSNLLYTKGILHLLHAFDDLSKVFPNVHLHIAGDIISDKQMSRKRISLELQKYLDKNESISYYGTVGGKEKTFLMEKSDVFVLPTFYLTEGLPFSILESMGAGLTIITTRHNYLEELVSENEGLLIESESIPSLFNALNFFVQNPNEIRKRGINSIIKARNNYSKSSYTYKMNKLFSSLQNREFNVL